MTSIRLLGGWTLAMALCAGAGARDMPPAPTPQEQVQVARTAIQARDWRRAIAALEDALAGEPDNADIHNLLAYSYRKQPVANLPKAFVHYRRALTLDPLHRGAHEYIGEAYLANRQLREAEQHLEALEKICGGRTCEEYRDLAQAISDYRARLP